MTHVSGLSSYVGRRNGTHYLMGTLPADGKIGVPSKGREKKEREPCIVRRTMSDKPMEFFGYAGQSVGSSR
jgi:hypothetical protein